MSKRVIAMALAILAFFLFIGSPFQQAANAVAIVDDALIAIIIAVLSAWGITFTYTGGYYTLFDWVANEIVDSGIEFTGLNVGVNTLSNLLLSNRFVRQLSAFAAYLITKYSINHNDNINLLSPTVNVYDELSGRYYVPAVYVDINSFVKGTMLWNYDGGSANGYEQNMYFRFSGLYYRFKMYREGTIVYLYSYTSDDGETWEDETLVFSQGQVESNPWRYEFYTVLIDDEVWLLMRTRERNNSNENAYVHECYKLQSVSLGNTLDLESGFVSVPDDQTIADQGGILELPVPWGQNYGEIIDDIPGLSDENGLKDNTTLRLDSEEYVESQIDTESTNTSISNNASDYQVSGLASVFPFCIPFDLYNFVSCLAADPVAPSFTWRFYVPGICDETIVIDLSEFDQAAQILRTMELLLFCVGLAFVTRKIIRG